MEIQRYLKTGSEFDRGKEVIQRNTDIVQISYRYRTDIVQIANGEEFQSILNHMRHYGYSQGDWEDSI